MLQLTFWGIFLQIGGDFAHSLDNLSRNEGEPEGRIFIFLKNNWEDEENNNTNGPDGPKSLLQILVWIIQPDLIRPGNLDRYYRFWFRFSISPPSTISRPCDKCDIFDIRRISR